VAVDIQSEMLRRAREKARSADVTNIRFCQLAIEPGNLGSERYDRAILVTVSGDP